MSFILTGTLLGALLGALFPAVGGLLAGRIGEAETVHQIALLAVPVATAGGGLWCGLRRRRATATADSTATKGDDEASKELRVVLDNIDSAVCTIDTSFYIGADYNRRLTEIFGTGEYSGTSIFDNIFHIIEDDTKSDLKEFFLVSLESNNASKEILNAALPFREFTYIFTEGGRVEHRLVSISCDRIEIDGENRLLLVFDDVSATREQSLEAQKNESRFERQYELIVALLSNEREIVFRFLEDAQAAATLIKQTIQKLVVGSSNTALFDRAIGTIHSLKGESFSLGFKELAKVTAEFELFMKDHRSDEISMELQLLLIGRFEALSFQLGLFDKVAETIASFAGSSQTTRTTDSSVALLTKTLRKVAETAAVDQEKHVSFHLVSNVDPLSERVFHAIKEGVLHLIRNSIAHGIQPSERSKAEGEEAPGRITLSIERRDDEWEVAYRDNGSGVDIEKVKARAIENGLVSRSRAEAMDDRQALTLIFRDGFTTSDESGMISGTGAGMGVVKRLFVDELGGTIKIGSSNKGGFHLRFVFPAVEGTK